MLKKLVFLPVLALTLFAAEPIVADSHHQPACHCQKGMDKLTKKLNLSADQMAKIKSLRDSNRAEMKANKEKLHQLKMEMHQLVMSDNIDQAKLNNLVNQKATIMASMMKSRIMMQNQIYNMLNADQKSQFSSMMKKWEEKHND